MSEASKEGRRQNRAKAVRLAGPGIGSNDPQKRVDASSWTPPEALDAGRKTGARPIRPRIYKHGGKIQGDRAPRHPGKAPRAARASGGKVGTGPLAMTNVADENKREFGSFHEGGYKRGGMPKSGASLADIKTDVHKHESHMHKGEKKTRLATGGRAKGKTNINIVIAQPKGPQDQMMPPQGPVRPPMSPPPPPQMQPPAGGPPPMPMGGAPGGGPPGAGPMMRKAGGRANSDAIPIRHAGAGSGEGRLERMRIQERSTRARGGRSATT